MARSIARSRWRTSVRAVLGYALLIVGGTLALDWLDYRGVVHAQARGIYLRLGAATFLALGVYLGSRLTDTVSPAPPGNPDAVEALGISPRELAVLAELAAGLSNKEIAARLGVSPNTVKSHVARLYEKLDARRRTEALARARDLGLIR